MLSNVNKILLLMAVSLLSFSVLANTTSSGEAVDIEEKGFSITPPLGWSINLKYPNTTLLLEAPKNKTDKYRRTIQVLSFSDPRYMDDLSAEEFSLYISKNFSKASSLISDYEIRDRVPVELDNGFPGYLFYASFKIDNTELMQMHVLVSSATRHFLITYTDLASFFDTDVSSEEHLNEAWKTVSSIKLDSPGPVRFAFARNVTIFLVAVLLGGFALIRIRGRRAANLYREYAEDKHLEYSSSARAISGKSKRSDGPYGTIQEPSLYETAIETNIDADYGDDEDEFKHAG